MDQPVEGQKLGPPPPLDPPAGHTPSYHLPSFPGRHARCGRRSFRRGPPRRPFTRQASGYAAIFKDSFSPPPQERDLHFRQPQHRMADAIGIENRGPSATQLPRDKRLARGNAARNSNHYHGSGQRVSKVTQRTCPQKNHPPTNLAASSAMPLTPASSHPRLALGPIGTRFDIHLQGHGQVAHGCHFLHH